MIGGCDDASRSGWSRPAIVWCGARADSVESPRDGRTSSAADGLGILINHVLLTQPTDTP